VLATTTYTRANPLAVVYCTGRRSQVPMVTDACVCGVVHNMDDQSLWYPTRVGGNSENGFEPFCKGHDVDDAPAVLVYSTTTPAPLSFPPTTHNGDTYGLCTGCGCVEVRLTRPTGTRDLSGNGGHPAYPTGYGCEVCD